MDPTSSAPEHQPAPVTMNGNGVDVGLEAPPPIEAIVEANDISQPEMEPVQQPAPHVPAPTTYDDLFPSLPSGPGAGMVGGSAPNSWSRKPVLQPSSITRVLNIPRAERRAAANGESGFGEPNQTQDSKTLRNVMDRSGAKIEMSSSKDQTLTFLITGPESTYLKAKAELTAAFQTQTTQTLSIPKEHHRFILGKGGERLQKIEADTATKINMPKVNEETTQITITGPRDGIELAIHRINEVSNEQGSKAYEVLEVSKVYHPIFRSGAYADKFRNEFPLVKVNIPPISIMKNEISVAGEKESVLKVKDFIEQTVKDMEKKFDEVVVQVKKSKHKYVIGPRGKTINDILLDFGVIVEMPNADSDSETVTLRGPQDKLPFALTKVYEKANSMMSHEIHCPTWLHKYIIGRKGAAIQKLNDEYPNVHVSFLDSGDIIKIDGPPEDAEKIREEIEKQAQELMDNTEFVEITVDAKYHKHIIGKGGSTVNRLKQERDVQINIPDDKKGTMGTLGTVIRIEGNKAGVRAAQAELEGMVSKMENEKEKDLVIENRFHRQLIGPKGETIQQIRDNYASVQISFPAVGDKSDIVKLRGPKQDVDKCALDMTKKYKALVESNYQVKVHIFKQFHKFIIGKAGATINQIRQDTNTKIDLPESGSDSDMITITGKKADVEKARDQVQKIQEEKASVVSIEVKIPAKIHNTIIGAGGKIIQSIMDDCGGVHIKFPEANSGSDKVTVRGPAEDVEKARGMLESLSTEKQLTSETAEVRAKPEHHKFLIGVKGANIKSVREETGARIIFPTEKDTDREAITILGTKEAVAQAKKELEARIKALDNVTEDTMTVDPQHHKYFTNKRGEILRNIGDEFGGVIISFPRHGVDSDKVTLKGAKDCIAGARQRIEDMIEDLVNQVTIECVIEQRHHRSVMGTRGSNVQRICKDFDVQIKIPEKRLQQNGDLGDGGDAPPSDGSCDIIRISGKKDKCDAAAEALQALVPVNLEVEVPFEFHRFIIGQKGEGVRELMNRFNVNIKVPNSEEQSSVVIVTGTPDNVREAQGGLEVRMEEIQAKLDDAKAKSFMVRVSVNPEYHPKIIGRRGANIMKMRQDYDVNIQLPKQGDEEQDVITITGYENKAEEAKAAILAIVDEFESMIHEHVEIDHRIHSYIIGRRGAEIRKIQQKFNVDLRLPKEGDTNPDLITISGDEEGVADCKDHLLNIQEEYLQDELDRESVQQLAPSRIAQQEQAKKKANNNNKGFEVKGAPWQGASDDAFPTLGGGGGATASTPVWGPRR